MPVSKYPSDLTLTTGPTGATGPSVAVFYTHNQSTPSATWVIVHNLGAYPVVKVIDSGLSECEGSLTYNSSNQITIIFSAAFAGTAYVV